MSAETEVFVLYANCRPVRGAKRALLCDLQLGRVKLIPNSLYDLLTEHAGKSLAEIKAAHDQGDGPVIEEYYRFLTEQDWGFWSNEPAAFPALDLDFQQAEPLTDAIIDADTESRHDYADLIAQLDGLCCRFLQLRFYAPVTVDRLDEILRHAETSSLRGIEIMIPDHDRLDRDGLIQLCRDHARIAEIVVHSSPENGRTAAKGDLTNMGVIAWTTEVISSEHHCGAIGTHTLRAALPLFVESQEHNTCLNRKISVDKRGQIRNCPSMATSFGHASETRLADVLVQDRFREPWRIAKDRIAVCKTCELRHTCSDCRAYLSDPEDAYSKPLKCGYDPYSASWAV